MKQALPGFNNLIKASNPLLQGIAQVLPDLGQDFSTFFSSLAEAGPDATVFLQDFIKGLGRMVVALGNGIQWLANAYTQVKQFISGIQEPGAFGDLVDSIKDFVINGLEQLVANLPDVLQRFIAFKQQILDVVVQIALGIAEQLPTIIPQLLAGLSTVITTLVTGLAQSAPKIVQAAGALLTGLVTGLTASLPTLLDAATSIVETLLTGIVDLIPVLIPAGLELVTGLVTGIVSAIPQLITTGGGR